MIQRQRSINDPEVKYDLAQLRVHSPLTHCITNIVVTVLHGERAAGDRRFTGDGDRR